MSPTKEVAEKKTTAVATTGGGYAKYEGGGYEQQTAADVAIPTIDVLQLSKRKDDPRKENPARGEFGDLFNTVTRDVIPGAEGLIVVPCVTEHVYVEWTPRNPDGSGGGGPHNFYSPQDPTVQEAKERAESFNKLKLPNGNQLSETFQMFAMILDEDENIVSFALIGFTSSKIKGYKAINTKLRSFLLEIEDPNAEGGVRKIKPPLFSHRLRMTSEIHDEPQEHAVFVLTPLNGDIKSSLIPEDSELLEAGNELKEMVLSGVARDLVRYESTETEDLGDAVVEGEGPDLPF